MFLGFKSVTIAKLNSKYIPRFKLTELRTLQTINTPFWIIIFRESSPWNHFQLFNLCKHKNHIQYSFQLLWSSLFGCNAVEWKKWKSTNCLKAKMKSILWNPNMAKTNEIVQSKCVCQRFVENFKIIHKIYRQFQLSEF